MGGDLAVHPPRLLDQARAWMRLGPSVERVVPGLLTPEQLLDYVEELLRVLPQRISGSG